MATTAPQALSVDEARAALEAARSRLAEADGRFRAAQGDLVELEAADHRVRAKAEWILGHDRTRSAVVAAAEDLGEARTEYTTAEQDVNAALASRYTSGLGEWRGTQHRLGEQADALLDALASVLIELRKTRLTEISYRNAASVAGPDILRFDRLVASGISRSLSFAAPGLELAFNPYRVRLLAEVFTELDPAESEQ